MSKNTQFNPFSMIGYPMCNENRNKCNEFAKCDSSVQLHTLTYSDQYGTYSVSSNLDCSALGELVENLVVPVMLAAGYHRDTILEHINAEP